MELGRLAQQGCMHGRVVKRLSSATGWKNVQENAPGDYIIMTYTELPEATRQEEFMKGVR